MIVKLTLALLYTTNVAYFLQRHFLQKNTKISHLLNTWCHTTCRTFLKNVKVRTMPMYILVYTPKISKTPFKAGSGNLYVSITLIVSEHFVVEMDALIKKVVKCYGEAYNCYGI